MEKVNIKIVIENHFRNMDFSSFSEEQKSVFLKSTNSLNDGQKIELKMILLDDPKMLKILMSNFFAKKSLKSKGEWDSFLENELKNLKEIVSN